MDKITHEVRLAMSIPTSGKTAIYVFVFFASFFCQFFLPLHDLSF